MEVFFASNADVISSEQDFDAAAAMFAAELPEELVDSHFESGDLGANNFSGVMEDQDSSVEIVSQIWGEEESLGSDSESAFTTIEAENAPEPVEQIWGEEIAEEPKNSIVETEIITSVSTSVDKVSRPEIKVSILPYAKAHPHLFRHTFATRMLQAGYMDEYVQQLLGHKSIATTKDIYSHVLDEMSLDAYLVKEEE